MADGRERKRTLSEPRPASAPKRTGRDDILAKDVTAPLPAVAEKYATMVPMDETPSEYVRSYALGELRRAQPADNDMPLDPQSTFDEKLRYKVLMLEAPPPRAKQEQEEAPARPKGRHVTAKQARAIDARDAATCSSKYEDYLPLHTLWCGYAGDLLRGGGGTINAAAAQQKMAKADWHGAVLSVVRARCPSLVGASGIVIKETENTFVMATQANRLITVPKAHAVFTFAVDGAQFTIYGDHICFRASERAVRKFKTKASIDL